MSTLSALHNNSAPLSIMDDRMMRSSDSDSDSVEISSHESVDRKNSVKTAFASAQPFRKYSITDHDDRAAQRNDLEYVASPVSSSKVTQCRGNLALSPGTKREARPNRRQRHVFDDLTKVNFNTSLQHPGRSEMWFGDLDFNFDINAAWDQDVKEEEFALGTETMSLMSQLLNDAAASYVQMNALSMKNKSI
mmetsp:Transcript_4445/g.6814  ORF Transcript_4445/g.6814 Transcript_4445/m.6814 type:complete len:192 (+) Transcript_4445:62-637(+)